MNIYFVSLGCDKNLVDSEVMLGMLHDKGHAVVDDEYEADVAVINTCCFIHDAKEESITTILELAELKKTSRLQGLIVAGCLAERYKEEIISEIPEVDILIGTTAYDEIAVAVETLAEKKHLCYFKDINYLPEVNTKRLNTTGGYFGYLKIAEGCDRHCTYCAIPSFRGGYRSVPMERLIDEAKDMVEKGIKELIVVAQDTTIYGTDLYGEKKLHELLTKLCDIEGVEWIRLLYCYPEEVYDALIDTMAAEDKICKYIDLPIQHASDSILKRMGRHTDQQEIVDIVNKLRSRLQGIAIRTSLITGFPGETEEDHKCLVSFIKEMKFERLGVFTYSKEEGTPAAKLKNQINKKIKLQRQKELMLVQQNIAFKKAEEYRNQKMKAIIDGYLPEDNVYVGRTYMDAPNIDGMVFIEADENLMSGDMVDIEVTGSYNYDLTAKLIRI